jgi:hypothetical protein
MKKNSSKKSEEKSVFYQAGEIIGSIGFRIADGKDKVMGVIKKKLGKKQTPEVKAKKSAKKKSSAKSSNKDTGTVKKSTNKAGTAKSVRKKAGKVKKTSKAPAKKDTIPTTES